MPKPCPSPQACFSQTLSLPRACPKHEPSVHASTLPQPCPRNFSFVPQPCFGRLPSCQHQTKKSDASQINTWTGNLNMRPLSCILTKASVTALHILGSIVKQALSQSYVPPIAPEVVGDCTCYRLTAAKLTFIIIQNSSDCQIIITY